MLILTIGDNKIELNNFADSSIQDYLNKQSRLFGKYINEDNWEGILKIENITLPVRIEHVKCQHQTIK